MEVFEEFFHGGVLFLFFVTVLTDELDECALASFGDADFVFFFCDYLEGLKEPVTHRYDHYSSLRELFYEGFGDDRCTGRNHYSVEGSLFGKAPCSITYTQEYIFVSEIQKDSFRSEAQVGDSFD